MPRITLDGSEHNGLYRGQCECGAAWNGGTEHSQTSGYIPALPIADAVVHVKLCHNGDRTDVIFTTRFKLWLERYWALRSSTALTTVASGPSF